MTNDPVWILDNIVETVHEKQLAEHGGITGIRAPGLLASALARPRQLYAYGGMDATLCNLAAAYAYGLARNHPFFDGNKRTAFVIALLFLRLNGYGIHASNEEKYAAFIGLADGTLSERELAEWLVGHESPLGLLGFVSEDA